MYPTDKIIGTIDGFDIVDAAGPFAYEGETYIHLYAERPNGVHQGLQVFAVYNGEKVGKASYPSLTIRAAGSPRAQPVVQQALQNSSTTLLAHLRDLEACLSAAMI